MPKILITILIALFTLITALIGVNQPTLHKQAMFTDEYHEFVEEELPTANVGFTNVEELPQRPIVTQVVTPQPKKQGVPPTTKQEKPLVKTKAPVAQQTPQKVQQNIPQKVVQQPKQNTAPQQVKKEPAKVVEPTQQNKPHELTEQEEIIVWNKWRSNLQNQVMKDAPVRAPLGTKFKFSFTVDKYGNMSNIKVWSENPNYTDLAVRVIKPVLTSYNHKPILNFPQGTKRVITNVTGGYVIATRTEYSKPSDYSDYEKVKR